MFEPGTDLVVRDVWEGLLWAARPMRVVEDDGQSISCWAPVGTVGRSATSRSVPGREGLDASERQLASLETSRWNYRDALARGTSLVFTEVDRWASIAPTWFPDGRFAHWYVNFQIPTCRSAIGLDTMDLIIDIVVAPDRSWSWKDRATFETATKRGLFDGEIASAVEDEASRIRRELEAGSGPFSEQWKSWRAPTTWSAPTLPDDFAAALGTPPDSMLLS